MNKIIEVANHLKKQMLEKFPGKPSTLIIKIWEDDDFMIDCKFGDGEKIHKLQYHKFRGTTEYMEEECLSNAIKEDAFGNTFYIPEELITYLNK